MHRTLTLLVFMLFISYLTGITYAAEKEVKPNLVAGAVKIIDRGAKTITIRADNQPDFTFSFNDETALRSNSGQKITFDDIKVGTILVLIYDIVDGKNIAKSITTAGQVRTPVQGKKG